jgi:hypothetical protein
MITYFTVENGSVVEKELPQTPVQKVSHAEPAKPQQGPVIKPKGGYGSSRPFGELARAFKGRKADRKKKRAHAKEVAKHKRRRAGK